MSYQDTYHRRPDYVIGTDYTASSQESLGTRLKNWLAATRVSPPSESAMHQAEIDRYHALLAARALRHTVALSALEQKAVAVAPQGTHRYQAIVDGYTEAAVRMVRGWR